MKLKLKGRRFDTVGEIQGELQRVLDSLTESVPKMEMWDRCLYAGGNYFEGDGGR
jgi:hypothetical protein